MKTECNAVFLFIAELTGSFVPGSGTVETKIECGQQDYITNKLHDLDLTNEEDRKDLHENVWLERLYAELDAYFSIGTSDSMARSLSLNMGNYRDTTYKWQVPIECDASALA